MKKYINSLKFKIIFRCDAADIPELGTGHLYRSLIIANYLKKKFSLKDKDIGFLIKTTNKYSKSLKILKEYKFRILKVNSKIKDYSKEECSSFKKYKSDVLIIDRLGSIKKKFFYEISDNFTKKIIIDDSSTNRDLFDLSINPLIQNVKKTKQSKIGFKYLILQAYESCINIKENSNIFLFVGGYDKKKLSKKILKLLSLIDIKLNIFLPASYKKIILNERSKHQLTYFKSSEYLQNLYSSNIAITAGGIGLFDAILAKKKILCFSQYLHQKTNIKKIEKLGALKFFNINENKIKIKFCKSFLKIYNNNDYKKTVNKIQNQIINNKMLRKTFCLISKTYEKSQTRNTF